MKRKSLLMCLSLLVCTTLAIGGTLAYLTDTETTVNTFTMGNVDITLEEDFEQGAPLLPGVNIEKKPVITNVSNNDAWVWMVWSIPAALDIPTQGSADGSSDNTVHWNYLAATTEGYVNQTRVDKSIADGYLDADLTAEDILASNKTWEVYNSLGQGKNMVPGVEIDGVEYNSYVLLYNKALEPGETTLPSVVKVYLDAHVDITPEGDLRHVEAGKVTELDWNINEDGNPKIIVSAFAIQKDGFETVDDGFAAFMGQWTADGTIDADLLMMGSTGAAQAAADSAAANDLLAAGTNVTLSDDMVLSESLKTTGADIYGAGHTLTPAEGQKYAIESKGGLIKNVNFDGFSRALYITGALKEDVVVEDCYFDGGTYTLNVNSSTQTGYDLIVKGTTLNGWTSYGSGVETASFTNCTFGQGSSAYAYCRPYVSTTFVNCEFEAGFQVCLECAAADSEFVFENCTLNGVALTDANIGDLLCVDGDGSYTTAPTVK